MTKWTVAIALTFIGSTAHAGLVCYEYKYAPNLVRAVQTNLKEAKFYNGPVDGTWGPKTKEAVHKFQVARHIELPVYEYAIDSPEGQLDEQTLKAMFGDKAPSGGTRIPNPHRAPESVWASSCQ